MYLLNVCIDARNAIFIQLFIYQSAPTSSIYMNLKTYVFIQATFPKTNSLSNYAPNSFLEAMVAVGDVDLSPPVTPTPAPPYPFSSAVTIPSGRGEKSSQRCHFSTATYP
ncbi:hypothetical protein GcC1_154008 [Golovinomyces cichoracearum]|uniref:Uncharacterized protein n=1 Tax=Golovinomyces cichoracearum TaxID=62708 RepID=A0A420HW11_9PEZI|nr:hypothetical protein GcC1_154008 [Golovinomyces cichoracearum]